MGRNAKTVDQFSLIIVNLSDHIGTKMTATDKADKVEGVEMTDPNLFSVEDIRQHCNDQAFCGDQGN